MSNLSVGEQRRTTICGPPLPLRGKCLPLRYAYLLGFPEDSPGPTATTRTLKSECGQDLLSGQRLKVPILREVLDHPSGSGFILRTSSACRLVDRMPVTLLVLLCLSLREQALEEAMARYRVTLSGSDPGKNRASWEGPSVYTRTVLGRTR